MIRTSVTHSVAPRVPVFGSYRNFTSTVIYYWTEAPQYRMFLLKRVSYGGKITVTLRWKSREIDFGLILRDVRVSEDSSHRESREWGLDNPVLFKLLLKYSDSRVFPMNWLQTLKDMANYNTSVTNSTFLWPTLRILLPSVRVLRLSRSSFHRAITCKEKKTIQQSSQNIVLM